MIRLAALACGLLCGMGLLLSGWFRPLFLSGFPNPAFAWGLASGLGLVACLAVIVPAFLVARRLSGPFLGGAAEQAVGTMGWKLGAGGLLFGLGWGLAGYFPLAALVSAGLFAPGAVIFLVSVLGGMVLHDLIGSGGLLNIVGLRARERGISDGR